MRKEKVVVGMSGGVDSSVAAYLLKERGYDVIGVTMQIWQEEDACAVEWNGGCCGLRAVEDQLSHTIMPIGDYGKEDVRRIAKSLGLAVAEKPDSQEICFIPDNDYGAFLDRHGEMPGPGNFVDREGNVLGKHRGLHHYTVGQRKGLRVSFGKPLYVCEIRPETDEVVLGNDGDTYTGEVVCRDINHMAVADFSECSHVTAKIRYGDREYGCGVEYLDGGYLRCRFLDKARAAAPGQAIVFYQDETVLGGGRIVRSGEISGMPFRGDPPA